MAKSTSKNKPVNLKPVTHYLIVDGNIEEYENRYEEHIIFTTLKDCADHIEEMVIENATNPEDYSIYKLVFVGKPKPIKLEFDFNVSE